MAPCDENISVDSCSFTNNINNININDHYTTIGLTMMATATGMDGANEETSGGAVLG